MALETLRDLWERNARLHPDLASVVSGSRRLSHAEFLERSARLADAFAARGVRPGDRVAMLAMNCGEYLEFLAANHLLGSIATPLNFRLAGPELRWILDDAEPSLLIFESQYAGLVAELRAARGPGLGCIAIGPAPQWAEPYERALASARPALPAHRPRPGDLAHLLYTSGTTGRPKGVMRSHAAELAMSQAMSCGLDMRPGSRLLQVMPLFHLGAQSSTWGLAWRAGTLHVQRSFDAREMLGKVASERITHLHLVPLMVQDMLELPDLERFELSSLETLLYSAAPMPPAVLRRGVERMGRIFVGMWGMTEGAGTLLAKDAHRPEGTAEEVGLLASVGQEWQQSEIRIVGESGRDCEVGITGELWLRAPSLLSGYFRNESATREALGDGWLRTGDMGYFDARRNVFLVDRKKDMIISGGENIYSQEVERALAEHPDVGRVAVIGVPDPRWGESVLAVVVPRAGTAPGAQALIDHCAARIASYKKPRRVEFVDDLPVLPSGKIHKVALRERFARAP